MVRGMRSRSLVGTALVSVVAALVAATPASAYLRNFHVVRGSSSQNSKPIKGLVLPVGLCGGLGSGYIGGFASVSPPLTKLAVTEMQPFGGLLYGGSATDTTGGWRVFARGMCAENTATPPTPGTAASYIKGLAYRSATSRSNSLPLKTATARCPTGKTAIGGGARITTVGSNIALLGLQRAMGVTAVRAAAHEVDATGVSWKVRVTAICANVTSGTPTTDYINNVFQTVNPPTPPSSNPSQTVFRGCPPGYVVVGGGGRILGGAPFNNTNRDVALVRSEPFFNGTVWGWIVEGRETDPTAGSWRVNASVTCGTANGGPPV
jgi:hypothetical protein